MKYALGRPIVIKKIGIKETYLGPNNKLAVSNVLLIRFKLKNAVLLNTLNLCVNYLWCALEQN